MSRITIAPIVEGHGDDAAVRILLQRVWMEVVKGEHATILHPIRRSRGRLLLEREADLEKAVNFAVLKLAQAPSPRLVLILVDAENDCQRFGSLGPLLLQRAQEARSDVDVACVIANVMYETWFVAAAESLQEYLNLTNTIVPQDPEAERRGKPWVKQHMRSRRYTETADQARLTAKMNLALCRTRSKSFNKLCRELESRARRPWPPT